MKSDHVPFLPSPGGPTDSEVEEAKAVLAARDEARKRQESNALVKCEDSTYSTNNKGPCGQFFLLGDAVLIQTQFYVEPYSCTGGDYWKDDELRLECPHCGRELRLFDSPDLAKLASRSALRSVTRR